MTVDGVVTVIDAAALAAGRFADDPEAVARQRAADPAIDHDNPLEEVFRRPARLRRSRDPQQDRSARSGRARRAARRDRGAAAAGREAGHRARRRRSRRRWRSALPPRPRTISPRVRRCTSSKASTTTTISTALSSSRGPVADPATLPRPRSRLRSARTTCCGSKALSMCPGRDRRQVVQAVGDRIAAAFRPALGGRRDARDAARRDRPQGPRPRRDRGRAGGGSG